VDFVGGALAYRRLHGGGAGRLLARAVGVKGGHRPTVLDATAGLGRDGFLLASLGCQVVMMENHPLVFVLLEDGVRRACLDDEIGQWVRERIQIRQGNTITYMQQLNSGDECPEVVYLDPMYAEDAGKAGVKKDMQVLRELLEQDETGSPQALFDAALQCATKRVVVKRPLHSATLVSASPQLIFKGRSTRYDVYILP
jgi:16S rRNA (guanine1516-N2)-methyltransferase